MIIIYAVIIYALVELIISILINRIDSQLNQAKEEIKVLEEQIQANKKRIDESTGFLKHLQSLDTMLAEKNIKIHND